LGNFQQKECKIEKRIPIGRQLYFLWLVGLEVLDIDCHNQFLFLGERLADQYLLGCFQ
jgi:hypothetical protein